MKSLNFPPYSEELKLFEKYIKKYDKNLDGVLNFEEFQPAFRELIGGSPEFCKEAFKLFSENNENKYVTAKSFATNLSFRNEALLGNFLEIFSTVSQNFTKEIETHHIGAKLGKFEDPKAKVEVKFTINQEEAQKLFKEASVGLKIVKENTGIIIHFYTLKIAEVRLKIEKFVKGSLAVIKNTLFKPNSFIGSIINSLKFEYSQTEDSVIVAVHTEHKGLLFVYDYFNIFYEKFNLNLAQTTMKFELSLKNDLYPLLEEEKSKRNLIQVLKEGFVMSFDLHTNINYYLKNALRPKDLNDIDTAKLLLLSFLQNGSKVDVCLDNLNLTDFMPESMRNSPLPEVDFWEHIWEHVSFLKIIRMYYKKVKEMKLPIMDHAIELLEKYLAANIRININLPYFFIVLHMKIGGLKEFWNKIQVFDQ